MAEITESTPQQEAPAPTAPSTEPTSARSTIRIGTRRSALARIQTDIVEKALREAWPDKEYVVHAMDATADKDKDTPLPQFNAKSLWTHELEALLLEGELDLIVHSLKDVPTQLPAPLTIGSIFPREDPRDALVLAPRFTTTTTTTTTSTTSHPPPTLATLPAGSLIGTSSVRRTAQLRRSHPHLRIADVRGNVPTRLRKLDDPSSPFAALILAAAGLHRLGLGDRISGYLSGREGGMLHAVGQGALGVEVREADAGVRKMVEGVGCERTARACLAERSLLRTLEGGCSVPIGVETEWVRRARAGTAGSGGVAVGVEPARGYGQSGRAVGAEEEEGEETDELVLRAVVVSLDGQEAVETEMRRRIGSGEDADEFGWDVARVLVEKGADKILKKINLHRDIIREQGNA